MDQVKVVPTGYEHDFVAWTAEQGRLLRERRLREVDLDNVAEEIGDLGISIRRALRSRLAVLLQHLLKWRYQAELRCSSWQHTIEVQRGEIAELLAANPSLRSTRLDTWARAYPAAVRQAARETGLPQAAFPADCIWTIDQALDHTFWPEPDAPAP